MCIDSASRLREVRKCQCSSSNTLWHSELPPKGIHSICGRLLWRNAPEGRSRPLLLRSQSFSTEPAAFTHRRECELAMPPFRGIRSVLWPPERGDQSREGRCMACRLLLFFLPILTLTRLYSHRIVSATGSLISTSWGS